MNLYPEMDINCLHTSSKSDHLLHAFDMQLPFVPVTIDDLIRYTECG